MRKCHQAIVKSCEAQGAELLRPLVNKKSEGENLRLIEFSIFESKDVFEMIANLYGECQDFCVWGGYSRGSPTRLPFVFEMQYARPDAIAGAKVEGPARSAGGSSLAPAIARREAAGALAREV